MITLPISYYPASSDDNAQIQVMSERKGEIAQKMHEVRDSGLDEYRKRAVTDKLKAQSDSLNREIRRKQADKDYKAKLAQKSLDEKRLLNKAYEKQSRDSNAKLDAHA
jgi:hypothetical protein